MLYRELRGLQKEAFDRRWADVKKYYASMDDIAQMEFRGILLRNTIFEFSPGTFHSAFKGSPPNLTMVEQVWKIICSINNQSFVPLPFVAQTRSSGKKTRLERLAETPEEDVTSQLSILLETRRAWVN